ncbi:MAG: hypothetical protein WBP58_11560 [Chitinophagaceae bacterium]
MKPVYFVWIMTVLLSCQSQPEQQANTELSQIPVQDTTIAQNPQQIILKNGTVIQINETHPIGMSLSDIMLKVKDRGDSILFKDADPLHLVLHADLNGDGSEEILLHTTAAGTGAYGQIRGVTVEGDSVFREIRFPEIDPQREIFKGYMGHDVFSIQGNTLNRVFPVYLPTDGNGQPTGGSRTIRYELLKKGKNLVFIEANN